MSESAAPSKSPASTGMLASILKGDALDLIEREGRVVVPRTSQTSVFAKVKQSRVLNEIVEMNIALSKLFAELTALGADFADVLTPEEKPMLLPQIAATGGIAKRLRSARERLDVATAAINDIRRRGEDLRPESAAPAIEPRTVTQSA